MERLSAVEQSVLSRLERIHVELSRASNAFSFLEDALQTYRERHLSRHTRLLASLFTRTMADSDLRWPHRKILDVLLAHFDYATGQFRQIHFSRLVKEARVGKQPAQGYLQLLATKGYIRCRAERNRKLYRINEHPNQRLTATPPR